MGRDSEIDLKGIRELFELPEPEANEPTEFAKRVAATLGEALTALRASGTIEVEDANFAPLANEIAEAALEAKSAKQLSSRIVKGLIQSDFVEEVYGTDVEISSALRPFLDRI